SNSGPVGSGTGQSKPGGPALAKGRREIKRERDLDHCISVDSSPTILKTTVDRRPRDSPLMLGHTAAAALAGDSAPDLRERRRPVGGPQRPQLSGDLVKTRRRVGPVDCGNTIAGHDMAPCAGQRWVRTLFAFTGHMLSEGALLPSSFRLSLVQSGLGGLLVCPLRRPGGRLCRVITVRAAPEPDSSAREFVIEIPVLGGFVARLHRGNGPHRRKVCVVHAPGNGGLSEQRVDEVIGGFMNVIIAEGDRP